MTVRVKRGHEASSDPAEGVYIYYGLRGRPVESAVDRENPCISLNQMVSATIGLSRDLVELQQKCMELFVIRLESAAFDSTPFQAALVDSGGEIVAVNNAWRLFAEQNGASSAVRTGVGLNYLAVCRQARGRNAEEALLAALTLERVLKGDRPTASFQYPCHSAGSRRWFVCSVLPMNTQGAAMITHVHLGDEPAKQTGREVRKRSPGAIVDFNNAPESVSHWRRETRICQHVQEMTATGGWSLDLQRYKLRWTPETYRIHDLSPEAFEPTLALMLGFFDKQHRSKIGSAFLQAENSGAPFDITTTTVCAARGRIAVRITGRADAQEFRPKYLYGIIQDLTSGPN